MKFSTGLLSRIILLGMVFLLAGCSVFPLSIHLPLISVFWNQSFLRAIDPADSTTSTIDILAVYSQVQKNTLLIRLDFLRPINSNDNIKVILWDSPDFENSVQEAKIILQFTFENSHLAIISPKQKVSVSLYEESSDWLSFQITGLDPHNVDHATIIAAAGTTTVDTVDQVALHSVAQPANLFFSFFNTLPAATPAQALRRWDGAHTGPIGSRHGLRFLLENAEAFNIPITILDLKQPQSLYALSLLGQSSYIQQLVAEQLLFLPDVASGNAYTQAFTLQESRRAGLEYGIPISTAVYGALSNTFAGYDTYFYGSKENSTAIYTNATFRILPVSITDQSELLTEEGLTTSAIAMLAKVGSSKSASDLMIMGGDFPQTMWGDPTVVKKAFEYIASHPWINPLMFYDIVTLPSLPVSSYDQKCSNLLCFNDVQSSLLNSQQPNWQTNAYAQLSKLPYNAITSAAWDTFSLLTSPTDNAALAALRSQYQGTLDALLIAANWAADPHPMQICSESIAQTLCYLANENILAILSSIDGKILMLFSSDNKKATQWIAPFSQKIIGLSDPTLWKLSAGLASDPSLIEGAFAEKNKQHVIYQMELADERITFSYPDGTIKKTYELLENELIITVESDSTFSSLIPVFGDIQQKDGIIFVNEAATNNNQTKMTVDLMDSTVTFNSYLDSIDLMKDSENPSLAYPPGHYLPIPFSLINLENSGTFSIIFSFDQ